MKTVLAIWLGFSAVTALPCILMAGKLDEEEEKHNK